MTDLVFNIAKGKVGTYAELGQANDALIGVVLEASGLEAASTLKDYDTLAALLAGTSNEQTSMGRRTLTSVTVTVDDANDWLDVDSADLVWTAATGTPVGALVICVDLDTTSGTDANLIPLVCLDFVATPNGGDLTYQFAAGGWFRAS